MDADLQDEPEVLMQMYKLLREENLDVVYAVRASRPEGRVKRFCYYVFYRLYTFLADTPVNLDSGDFCVMTRRTVKTAALSPGEVALCARAKSLAWSTSEALSNPTRRSRSRRAAIFHLAAN